MDTRLILSQYDEVRIETDTGQVVGSVKLTFTGGENVDTVTLIGRLAHIAGLCQQVEQSVIEGDPDATVRLRPTPDDGREPF